ncbi:MAG: hypothetical protein LBR74_02455 [Eubacterium sp.]|nr:hypothetical protein [Eubacterium sp.]
MVDFKALSNKTYFITHTQGIKQFHALKATADGIQLYVRGNGEVNTLDYNDIGYILAENRAEYFGVADNFIQFLKTDLADAPLLFDFILAIWNEDFSKADVIFAGDESITSQFIRYMHTLVDLNDYTALLSLIFTNYLRFKK